MDKDGFNSQANVVKSVKDEDDVFLATNDEVAKKMGDGFSCLKAYL